MCERICVRWEELHCSVCVLCARVRPEPGRSFLQFKAVGHHWCVRDPAQMGGEGLHRRNGKIFNQNSKAPTPSRDQTATTVPVSRVWVVMIR